MATRKTPEHEQNTEQQQHTSESEIEEQNLRVCFVMMPISDIPERYAPGHFNRVYEYIIKPACKIANFKAVRADDQAQSNLIILDVLRQAVEAPMAVCDLTSNNPNVLYELGIRQAFNKPVALMIDDLTTRMFDTQVLRDLKYASSLRIDSVGKAVEDLAKMITATYEAREEVGMGSVNSLVQLLGLKPATLPVDKVLTAETSLILNALGDLSQRLNQLEDRPRRESGRVKFADTLGEIGEIPVGEIVKTKAELTEGVEILHPRFGLGWVKDLGEANTDLIEVVFNTVGKKVMALEFSEMRKTVRQAKESKIQSSSVGYA
jgi:hypothetical protein